MGFDKEPELSGRQVVPGNPQYDSARQEFTTYFNKFPLVIVFAQETKDVLNAVRWARYWDVPFRIRSDHHSYEGLAVVNAGIVIDVSEMKQVDVDRKNGIGTVQTENQDIDINEALGSVGLAAPTDLSPLNGYLQIFSRRGAK